MRVRMVALLIAIATSAFAQVKESINVTMVEVPVTVVGNDGAPVRGLTAANFELLDQGKKRPISAFDAIDFTTHDREVATAQANPAARRNFLLLFDLSYSSQLSITRAQEAARTFVTKAVLPRDRVAVGTLDVEHGFQLLTAFTTDRQLISSAINNPRAFRSNDPLQIGGSTPMVRAYEETPKAGALSGELTPREASLAAATRALNDIARQNELADDRYWRHKIDRELEILASVAQVLRSVAGRKQIVLLSEGFEGRLVSGREKMDQKSEQDQRAIERGEIWKVDSDSAFGSTSSQSLLQELAEMCKRSDAVLHAIDIRGLRLQNDPQEGAIRSSNEGLSLLANATGGHVFKNSNDIDASLRRMLHEQEVVYILGFHAPSNEAGKFHPLQVKLVNVPSARASYRSGYYERGSRSEIERKLSVAEVVVNDIPQNDFLLSAVATPFFHDGSSEAEVPVIVDIAGPELLKLADDPIVMAELYVYAFDENGTARDALFQRLTLDTSKVGEKLRRGGLKYYGTLALPPGTYAVKTLVRLPEIGSNAYTRTDLLVPQPGSITASRPLFFADASRWLLVRGASHAGNGEYPFIVGGMQFFPSASVQNGKFAVVVANAKPGDVVVETSPASSLVSSEEGMNGAVFVFENSGSTAPVVSVRKRM